MQSKRLVTATEISSKFDVSIRTVYRDIRTLLDSGIPIITVEGKGYSLMEGYRLPPIMFTEQEASALITAEQIINQNKDRSFSEQFHNAITKVKAVLGSLQKEKIELIEKRIQIRNNPEQEKTSNYLMQIQTAISDYRTLSLQYFSLSNKDSKRTVEPFALYTTKENWVLIAFCRWRNNFRAFRLDRMQKIQLNSERFEPHKLSLEEYFKSCRKKWDNTPDKPLT
nr:WYL domain-containing protein [Membranihabitans maritimus]